MCVACVVVFVTVNEIAEGAVTVALTDLDRSNLWNARLQGLPKDALGGDPTGNLYGWVNSVFFISYVGRTLRPQQKHECEMNAQCAPDPLPNTCNCYIEVVPSSHLDRSLCYGMGSMLNAIGMFQHVGLLSLE